MISLGSTVRRTLTLGFGCLGLVWGIFVLPQSEAADDFRDIESRLLRSETFNRTTLAQSLESQSSQNVSPCDTHSQRALLLMEMPLAEAALRAGAAGWFDRHIESLEARSRRVLSCAPRESFVWLLAFNLEALHGSSRSVCSICPTTLRRMRHGSRSAGLSLRCLSSLSPPNRFGRKFSLSSSSSSVMDLRMMRPIPIQPHPVQ